MKRRELEKELLLCLLRFEGPCSFPVIEESCWEEFLDLAESHHVVPLLLKGLTSRGDIVVSTHVFEKLRSRNEEITAHNIARTAQLFKLIELLSSKGIPVLSYKGMALAELAYKQVSLRQFTDIDLLIRKTDFKEVKRLFAEIDCRPVWELTDKQEKAVLQFDYEYPFFMGEINTLVELHWAFMEDFFAFDFDIESLWKRVQVVNPYGREIPTLSNEDYLLVIASHGSKHFWKRLSWICDLDRLIRNTAIDWDKVIELARKTGSLRMIHIGLKLSMSLLHTPLPAFLKSEVEKDKPAIAISNRFESNLFCDDREPENWIEMARVHLKMREKLTTKLIYSYRLFMTKLVDKLLMPMGRPR